MICFIDFARESEVRGPLAMIVGLLGIDRISFLITCMFLCEVISLVILFENKCLSIAKACPAGTVQDLAIFINNELSISNSLINKPEARSGNCEPKELEQTISPRLSV